MICPRCQQTIRDEARFCDSCGFSVGSLAASTQSPSGFAETLKAPDPLIGHVIDSKYNLIEQLGKGGMGVVYRAQRVLVGDEVALKILRGEFVAEQEAVERFRREARAAARLRHPNVVTIYDYGEARGADAPAYIVMELLNGESLRDLLKREGSLNAERAVTLMRGICSGIGMAHRRQIVHRDIKPDNIILLPPDEEEGREQETVKVVDFGIAKLRDPASGGTLTQKGFQPGTVYYMSPEQCRGDDLDARSDVYSLGALLYEMLAGTPPFMAETHTGVIAKHLFDPPPSFSKGLRIPAAVERVIMRALAKDPEARQMDAGALGRELQEAEQQEREAQRRSAEEERLRAQAEQHRLAEEARRQAAEEEQRREAEERQQQMRRLQEEAARLAALEEERCRVAAEQAARQRAEEERWQRDFEERMKVEQEEEQQQGRGAKTMPSLTEPAARQTDPTVQPKSDTAPERTRPLATEPSWPEGVNPGAMAGSAPPPFITPQGTDPRFLMNRPAHTAPVSPANPGFQSVGIAKKRGASKVWIVLGFVVAVALVVSAIVMLSNSSSSTDPTQSANNSSDNSSTAPTTTGAPNYQLLGAPLRAQRDIFKVALSPDGRLLAFNGAANASTVMSRTSDQATLQEIGTLAKASSSVAVHDGNLAAFGGEDGSVELFGVGNNMTRRSLTGHKDYVFFVAFTPDGSKLISASADKTVRVWNVSSGQQERQMQIGKDELIITIDPNQMRAAILYPPGGQVRIRSINNPAATSSFDNRRAEVTCGAFSPNGETLALGTSGGKMQLWSIPDGTFIREHQGPTNAEVGSVAFTPDGQYLAIGWNNGDIELSHTSDGGSVQTLKGHTRVVRTLSFNHDGRMLASGAEDKTIRLWQY